MKKYLFIIFLLITYSINAQSTSLPILKNGWERIMIENVGSFDIPPTMELQSGTYKIIKEALINKLNMNQTTFQIIIQQKGLNTFSEEGYSKYARIMFKTEIGENDNDFVLNMDINQFTRYDIIFLNNLARKTLELEFSGTGNVILEWYPLKMEIINSMSCMHTSYKRQLGNNTPVIVHNYHFFNYDYSHSFIMSYRESEKDYWENDFRIILNSLRIRNRR